MKIINQLNSIQKEAASNPEGAHLVMAGPGTGKTQLLTARIMSMILSDSLIQPNMILALTYTDAGAIAMRQRLVQFMGKDGYKVAIHTFHGLCNEIIQHNPDYFGVSDLDVISDIEAIQVMKNIIDGIKPNNPLYRAKGDQYWEIDRLRNLFSLMKNEDLNFDQIVKATTNYINSLSENPDFIYKRANQKRPVPKEAKGEWEGVPNKLPTLEKGDLNMDKIKDEIDKMQKMVAGAKLLEEYNNHLRSIKRYDFEDMIHWVIDAFNDHDYMKLYYQEKYQYVLVDEMQDTSGAQMSFLKLLLDFWEQANVFAVGDLDQTLYEFSGARIANITDFIARWTPSIYWLNQNYRSGQNILDHAKKVILNNPDHEGDVNPLQASRKNKSNGSVVVSEYGTIFEEEADVISKILTHDIPNKEIAVIYRKHRQGEGIAKALQAKGIPVNIKRKIDVMQEPVVKFIMDILKSINGYEQRSLYENLAMLGSVMFSEFSGLDPKQVANWLFINRSDIRDGKEVVANSTMVPFHKMLFELSVDAHTKPLILLVEDILTKFELIKAVAEKPNRYQLISYIHTFFGFLKAETRKNPTLTIQNLIHILDLMEENKIKLETDTLLHDTDGINLLTVHGAKGLEFKTVFMIGCTRNEWEGSRTPATNFKLPPDLNLSDENKENTNRRLFYVGMTRAEDHLYISYSTHNNQSKELEPTQFITEAGVEPVKVIPSDDIIEHLIHLTTPDTQDAYRIQRLEEKLFDEMMENYVMSVSHVNKYLRCQTAFFYENILRVPFVPTGALIFGNAVHRALRRTYDAWKERKSILSLEEFLAVFRRDLKRSEGQMSPAEFGRRMQAISMLINYYNDIVVPSNKVTQNEFKVANVLIEDIPFTGDFDKLEFNGIMVDIVDYKTGKYAPTKDALKQGGDYWRQLVTYKLLFDQIFWRKWKFNSARIEMIDAEYCGPLHLEITPEDEAIVKEEIKTVYAGIMNQEFSNGCGKPECKWCNLNK